MVWLLSKHFYLNLRNNFIKDITLYIEMKSRIPIYIKTLILLLVLLFPSLQQAQLSINLSSVTCNSLTASANTGTYTANSFSWSILPLGPIIYSSTAQNTIIRFPQSGNYTLSIMIQTSQGNNQTSQSLSIIAIPSLTIHASPDTVCWNQSSTISAGGAVNYSWAPYTFLSSSNTSITVTTPSTSLIYTLTANNGLGCTNTNTVPISFAFPPSVSIVATNNSVCIGTTATLSAYGATYFFWSGSSFAGVVVNQSLIAGGGTYTVVGSNGDGCKAEATFSIYVYDVPCPNSIYELNSNDDFIHIYPNPSKGTCFISAENRNITRINVVDVFGRIVHFEDKIPPVNEPIEVGFSNFPNGIYFVKINLDDGSSRALRAIKE